MASLQKRTWTNKAGAVSTGWRVTYTDQSGRVRTKQFKLRTAAKAFRDTVESTVKDGSHVHDRDTVTIGEAADIWLKASLNGRDGRPPVDRFTYKAYKGLVENHVRPRLGGMKLSKLTRATAAAFRDDLLADGVSRAMTKKAVTTLSSIVEEAMSRELVAVNRVRGVKVSVPTREHDEGDDKVEIPTVEQMQALVGRARLWSQAPPGIVVRGHVTKNPRFAKARGRMFYILIRLSVATGMRISEALGLPARNVDLKAGTVAVTQRLDAAGKLGKPKSKAGYRTIDIPADVVRELREWMLQRPKGEKDLVFPNASGSAERYANIYRRFWVPLLQAIGAARRVVDADTGEDEYEADFAIHGLRHFHASQYIATGATPLDVMTRMGHSSIQVTFDIYGHLFHDEAAKARRRGHVEEMERALFGPPSD